MSKASRGEAAARRDDLGRLAEQLRSRDRDAEAVSERRERRGLADEDLFDYAQAAARSVVTYNRYDFLELDRRFRSQGRNHGGIVVLNPHRFPHGQTSIGALVKSLHELITDGPPYESFIHWLQ